MDVFTISGTSTGLTPLYQIPAGYMTTDGPKLHRSKQPDLLARTLFLSPCFANSWTNATRTAAPLSPQHPFGLSGGRLLMQINIISAVRSQHGPHR